MLETLKALLEKENARFRVIRHSPEGGSAKVAAIRGPLPRQGAKAMLCRVKEMADGFVLAVLPGDRKLDFRMLAEAVGGKKASLAPADAAQAVTGCVMGAVPPFSFWPNVRLVVSRELIDENDEIAFNAGALDTSIVLNAADYVRIAQPQLASIVAS